MGKFQGGWGSSKAKKFKRIGISRGGGGGGVVLEKTLSMEGGGGGMDIFSNCTLQ